MQDSKVQTPEVQQLKGPLKTNSSCEWEPVQAAGVQTAEMQLKWPFKTNSSELVGKLKQLSKGASADCRGN